MSVKLLTEHLLEFLSLKGGCTCSSESTLVKMPHCWKSRHGSYEIFHIFRETTELEQWNTRIEEMRQVILEEKEESKNLHV